MALYKKYFFRLISKTTDPFITAKHEAYLNSLLEQASPTVYQRLKKDSSNRINIKKVISKMTSLAKTKNSPEPSPSPWYKLIIIKNARTRVYGGTLLRDSQPDQFLLRNGLHYLLDRHDHSQWLQCDLLNLYLSILCGSAPNIWMRFQTQEFWFRHLSLLLAFAWSYDLGRCPDRCRLYKRNRQLLGYYRGGVLVSTFRLASLCNLLRL